MPELVEKKDPPIKTSIKKMKDKFAESLLREKPIFVTLLVKDRNNLIKSLSKSRKIKKINNKVIK